MRIYHTINEFVQQCAQHKKWARTLQAIQSAQELLPNVAYSVGDSIAYWWQDSQSLAHDYYCDHYIGRRRYLTVLTPIQGSVVVQVAAKQHLQLVQNYSDLTDRELFIGEGTSITLQPQEILIVEPDEACCIQDTEQQEQRSTVIELHVTVEGFSFPNK